MTSIEHSLLNFIQTVYHSMGWYGVTALMAIESACIPFPSELIMPFAGWWLVSYLGRPVYWVVIGGLLGAIGNTVGSVVAYYVGKWAGRPLLNKYGKYVLLSRHDLDMTDRWFTRSGGWTVFVSRLLPIVRTYISLPAGIARMGIWKFITYTLTGSFIWSTGLAYGGYLLGANWERLRNDMKPFDPVFAAVIVILIGLYVWRHIRHLRSEKNT